MVLMSGSKEGEYIWRDQVNNQGGVAAMPFFANATRPIINNLRENCNTNMVWYPDDSSCSGDLLDLLQWWKKTRLNKVITRIPSKCKENSTNCHKQRGP